LGTPRGTTCIAASKSSYEALDVDALAIAFAVTSARAQTVLTLDDAIALGLAHNRTVANAALQVDKAEQDLAITRSRRLPSFKIEAQGSQLSDLEIDFRPAPWRRAPTSNRRA